MCTQLSLRVQKEIYLVSGYPFKKLLLLLLFYCLKSCTKMLFQTFKCTLGEVRHITTHMFITSNINVVFNLSTLQYVIQKLLWEVES